MSVETQKNMSALMTDLRQAHEHLSWYAALFFPRSISIVLRDFPENSNDFFVAFVMAFHHQTFSFLHYLSILWPFRTSDYHWATYNAYEAGLLSNEKAIENCQCILNHPEHGSTLGALRRMGFLTQKTFDTVMSHPEPVALWNAVSRLVWFYNPEGNIQYYENKVFIEKIYTQKDAEDYFDILSRHERPDIIHSILEKMIDNGLFYGENGQKNRDLLRNYSKSIEYLAKAVRQCISENSLTQRNFEEMMLSDDVRKITRFTQLDDRTEALQGISNLRKAHINALLSIYLEGRSKSVNAAEKTKEYFHGRFFAAFQKSFTQKKQAVHALERALQGENIDLTPHLSTLRNGQLGDSLRRFIKRGLANDLVGSEVHTIREFVAALEAKLANTPKHF